jgi:hypothetical protein
VDSEQPKAWLPHHSQPISAKLQSDAPPPLLTLLTVFLPQPIHRCCTAGRCFRDHGADRSILQKESSRLSQRYTMPPQGCQYLSAIPSFRLCSFLGTIFINGNSKLLDTTRGTYGRRIGTRSNVRSASFGAVCCVIGLQSSMKLVPGQVARCYEPGIPEESLEEEMT